METETALTNLTTAREKVNRVLALQQITLKDIEDFNTIEREYLGEIITETLQQAKGDERDDFLAKIEQIVPADTNDKVWEHNHFVIANAITSLVHKYGCMPPKTLIAEETGLSRRTIAKHIAGYKTHPEFGRELEQFKYMGTKVLSSVFKLATNGDVKAARLYFEMVGATNKQRPNMVITEQNNNIQVNNNLFSPENLKQLSPAQLKQIEGIIMADAEG
ncbi:MAG: hypothetical protein ABJA76_19930 [Mucilaginibacter sp.]